MLRECRTVGAPGGNYSLAERWVVRVKGVLGHSRVQMSASA